LIAAGHFDGRIFAEYESGIRVEESRSDLRCRAGFGPYRNPELGVLFR
jgi:hypothetical protein